MTAFSIAWRTLVLLFVLTVVAGIAGALGSLELLVLLAFALAGAWLWHRASHHSARRPL